MNQYERAAKELAKLERKYEQALVSNQRVKAERYLKQSKKFIKKLDELTGD